MNVRSQLESRCCCQYQDIEVQASEYFEVGIKGLSNHICVSASHPLRVGSRC
jgi:hypothetical protein